MRFFPLSPSLPLSITAFVVDMEFSVEHREGITTTPTAEPSPMDVHPNPEHNHNKQQNT